VNKQGLSVVLVFSTAILALTGCASAPVATLEVPTSVPTAAPTIAPESSLDPFPGWTAYSNSAFGISLRYPSTWYGPDVYEFEDGVRLEVGSDVVYPYGTGPEDRQPGAPNAYNVVIQHTLNTSGLTLEQYQAGQPWLNDTLAVLELQDGESITTARSLTTRQRGLTVGRFTGVEFTTTLPETAQTERFFMRTAFLMDEALNVIVINGSPDRVEIAGPSNWRAAFEAVDAANQAIFQELVESIQVE
jgi:hypothetical protein